MGKRATSRLGSYFHFLLSCGSSSDPGHFSGQPSGCQAEAGEAQMKTPLILGDLLPSFTGETEHTFLRADTAQI